MIHSRIEKLYEVIKGKHEKDIKEEKREVTLKAGVLESEREELSLLSLLPVEGLSPGLLQNHFLPCTMSIIKRSAFEGCFKKTRPCVLKAEYFVVNT